jgi:prepilin-type processing-associated H-X9-DG protein
MCTCGVTSAVGLVLAVLALTQIRRSRGSVQGTAPAIAGMVISAATLWLGANMYRGPRDPDPSAPHAACVSNMKQIALYLDMYAYDYDGHYPPKETWREAVYPYVRNEQVFRCPLAKQQELDSYAFNARLSGAKLPWPMDREHTVLLFESRPGLNLAGGPELLEQRHRGEANVAFADGHVASVRDPEGLVWRPEPE